MYKSYKKYRPIRKDGTKCRCTRSKSQADFVINATSLYLGYQVIEVVPSLRKKFIVGFVLPTIFVDITDFFV